MCFESESQISFIERLDIKIFEIVKSLNFLKETQWYQIFVVTLKFRAYHVA